MKPLLHTKPGTTLTRMCLLLFFVVYSAIFLQITLFNSSFGYAWYLQIALCTGWLAFLLVAGKLVYKHRVILIKHKYRLLAGSLLFIFLVQLYVGFATAQPPIHDYDKIYSGAYYLTTEGYSENFIPYQDYLHHFTNNVGGFMVLYGWMQLLTPFGLPLYSGTVVLGHLLFTLAVLFTFLYLDTTFGSAAALASLPLALAFLPVYFQSSIVYTDTLTIWAIPLALYLHAQGKKACNWAGHLGWYGGMAVCIVLGTYIKATVVLVGIAIMLELLFTKNWRALGAMSVTLLVCFTVVSLAYSNYVYSNILERERAELEAMPVTLWLMMGLEGDGAYNPGDHWDITFSVFGKPARTQLHLEIIQERLSTMGPGGYVQLLHRKTCRTFGSGSADINGMLGHMETSPTHPIFQFISVNGNGFRIFNNLSQCVYLSFYILSLAGTGTALKKRDARFTQNPAVFIALLGFWAFMMLWESNHRQLVNQWPLFISAAGVGLAAITQGFAAKKQKHS